MQLNELLSGVVVLMRPQEEIEITSIAFDSRKVEKGSLFCCIPGTKTDGHDYAKMAMERGAAALVVKEREYPAMLARLKTPPDLAVCDSQVVDKMVADTPPEIPCTTFSILFSRLKGDMLLMARGAAAIASLKSTDKVLIAEACSHHAVSDDIGRVKIPRWLRRYAGEGLQVDVSAGRDYPENLSEYKLVIHCGGCMLNQKELEYRMNLAIEQGVPFTNYGTAIAYMNGILKRSVAPLPDADF